MTEETVPETIVEIAFLIITGAYGQPVLILLK